MRQYQIQCLVYTYDTCNKLFHFIFHINVDRMNAHSNGRMNSQQVKSTSFALHLRVIGLLLYSYLVAMNLNVCVSVCGGTSHHNSNVKRHTFLHVFFCELKGRFIHAGLSF